MRQLIPACLCLALLAATAPVQAQDGQATAGTGEAEALDLALPQSSRAGYRNDPPGTWYGDTSGVPADTLLARPQARQVACPTAPDGRQTDVTGEVEVGIGHSSRGGNSNWQAATVNYCKQYATDDGGSRTVNLQLNVGSYDGPHAIHGAYGPYGPYAPGFGPMMGPPPPGWGPMPGYLHRTEPRPLRDRGEGR